MTTLFSTFPGSPPEGSLRFISYSGPPNQTPRRVPPSKVTLRKDEFPDIDTILGTKPDSNSELENREEPAHKADVIEVVDLTCSADNEANCEISGSGGTSDDVGSGDLKNERDGVLMPTSQEETGHRASRQPGPSEGSIQENAVVINNNQSDSEADSSDANEEDPGSHTANHDGEVVTDTINTITETSDRANAQTSELPHQRLSLTPPTSSSIVVKQSGGLAVIDFTSDSDDADDGNDGNKNNIISPQRGQIKMSYTTPNQATKLNTRPMKRQTSNPLNKDVNTIHRDVSSDDSSDDGIEEKPRNVTSIKPLCGQKRKRDHGSMGEDKEYEVKKILKSRFYRNKLQYRVKWLDYPEDPAWYNARNFKNSPDRLREFHEASPNLPGPPKRLKIWKECWEEDRDAADHPDDNKPEKFL